MQRKYAVFWFVVLLSATLGACVSQQLIVGRSMNLVPNETFATITEYTPQKTDGSNWTNQAASHYGSLFLAVDSEALIMDKGDEKKYCQLPLHDAEMLCGAEILHIGKGNHEILILLAKNYVGTGFKLALCNLAIEDSSNYVLEFAKQDGDRILFIPEMIQFVNYESGKVLDSTCKEMGSKERVTYLHSIKEKSQ